MITFIKSRKGEVNQSTTVYHRAFSMATKVETLTSQNMSLTYHINLGKLFNLSLP